MRGSIEDEKGDDITIPESIDGGEHGTRPLQRAHERLLIIPVPLVLGHLAHDVGDDGGGGAHEGGHQQETKPIDDALVDEATGRRHGWQTLLLGGDVLEGEPKKRGAQLVDAMGTSRP